MKDIGASVLARLKNKAKNSGISYQQCLQLFFQEEFLEPVWDSIISGENFNGQWNPVLRKWDIE